MPTTRPSGTPFGESAREPAGAAADVENVFVGGDLHELEDWLGDGPVVVLHGFAFSGVGPAVEFFAELILGFCVGHGSSLAGLAGGEIRWLGVELCVA